MQKIISLLMMLACSVMVHAGQDRRMSKEELLEHNYFVCFDLGLTEQEKQVIDSLVIEKTMTTHNYAQFDQLENQLSDYFQELGNDEQMACDAAPIIIRIARDALQLLDAPIGLIVVRAFTPNELYDTPRWHMDGSYFPPQGTLRYKFVCTLRGAPTLFLDLDEHARSEFRAIESQGFLSGQKKTVQWKKGHEFQVSIPIRQQVANYAQQFCAMTAGDYQGTMFMIGDRQKSVIHSEPLIKEPRIFMAVIPGTYEQVQEWRKENENK